MNISEIKTEVISRANSMTAEIVKRSLGRDLNLPIMFFIDNETRYGNGIRGGADTVHLMSTASWNQLFLDFKEWDKVTRHGSNEIVAMNKRRLGFVNPRDAFIKVNGCKGDILCGEMAFTAYCTDYRLNRTCFMPRNDIEVNTTEYTEIIGEAIFLSGIWHDTKGIPLRSNPLFNPDGSYPYDD